MTHRTLASLSLAFLAATLVVGPPSLGRAMPASEGGAAFHETFEQLDRDFWFVSSGWANGPHQNCTWHRDRVTIEDGKLELSLTGDAKGDRDLSCGEIQSEERYGYGTFEARMKVPYAEGMNANAFTFIGEPQNEPHNEIDFEFLARERPVLQTNYHTAAGGNNEELTPLPDDAAFHTYSVIWEPGRIRWFIDGEKIRDVQNDALPDRAQKFYLSLWGTETLTDWMGRFDPASAPQVLEVDWASYTPLGQDCAFEASVLCRPEVDAP